MSHLHWHGGGEAPNDVAVAYPAGCSFARCKAHRWGGGAGQRRRASPANSDLAAAIARLSDQGYTNRQIATICALKDYPTGRRAAHRARAVAPQVSGAPVFYVASQGGETGRLITDRRAGRPGMALVASDTGEAEGEAATLRILRVD